MSAKTVLVLLPVFVVTLSLQPAQAANLEANLDAHVDIYGKLELQGLYVEQGLLRYADQGWQIEAPSSRLGAKASQPLAADWSLLAVYEWQVNGLDHANQHHRFGSRNLYAGIANPSFGELTFGKNDSRFKRAEGKVDLFNETLADLAQLTPGQDRLENVLSYQSPDWQGLHIATTWQSGVSDETAGGYDVAVSYGDATLKRQPYYVAYARVHELNQLDANRLTVQHSLGHIHTGHISGGLMWQRSKHLTKALAGNAYLIQLAYQLQAWTYKVQTQLDTSRIRHASIGRAIHIGADYLQQNDMQWYVLTSYIDFVGTHDHATAIGFRWNFKL